MLRTGDTSDEDRAAIGRSAYTWNAVAGILNALQSVFILMAVTRACDVAAAGVFTLAYANGNLFLNVGKYGMRSFQASDRLERFSFSDYCATRVATTVAMIAAAGAYLAYLAVSNSYSAEKSAIVGMFCLYEAVTSIEDVFHGNFQQHDRLDVASFLFSMRIGSTIALLCVVVLASRSLVVASAAATAYTAAFLACELAYARRRFRLPIVSQAVPASPASGATGPVAPSPSGKTVFETLKPRNIAALLKTCFPLFLAAFLLFYICNAPRYAIDAQLGDAAQAYYGYVAMPVFVVSLLAGFIYNPMVTSLADQWNRGEARVFMARFGKVALAVVGLTALCDAAAFAVGVPVLDFLYKADTAPYMGDLIVLMTGGGFLALASLAVLGITIMRFQKVLAPAYVLVAVGAWALSGFAVGAWGIDGAAWAYFASMVALASLLTALFLVGVRVCRPVARDVR